jgi:hypothetical protein
MLSTRMLTRTGGSGDGCLAPAKTAVQIASKAAIYMRRIVPDAGANYDARPII